jgi:thiosulfate/3-mercaptopyruvate sulfurtransferase
MTEPASRWLVSTEWLAARLGQDDVVVVDGSYYLPTQKRDAHAEYRAAHIPGAVFFDIEEIADHSTDLPHMLPGPAMFSQEVSKLGIGKDDTIVVYDGVGLFAAPRVWWTFRLFGATKVYILDGGLPQWKAENRPVEAGEVKREPRRFDAEMATQKVATVSEVQLALASGIEQVVDARSSGRFRGVDPEPRPGLPSGHMPGALNLPYQNVLDGNRLAAKEKIAAAVKDAGIDPDKPVITSCGSGVTAAILWLALDAIGKPPASLFDGSWTEWASRSDLPIASEKKG